MIVDDYGNVPACRQAVHDFRAEHGITDAIQPIDWGGVYLAASRRVVSADEIKVSVSLTSG